MGVGAMNLDCGLEEVLVPRAVSLDYGLEEVLVPINPSGYYPMLKLTFDLWCLHVPALSSDEAREMLGDHSDDQAEQEDDEEHDDDEGAEVHQRPLSDSDEIPIAVGAVKWLNQFG